MPGTQNNTRKRQTGPRYTAEQCIEIILHKYQASGRRPKLKDFDYSLQYSVIAHFTTYNEALEKCAINPKIRTSQHLTAEQVIESLQKFYIKHGIRPVRNTNRYNGELYSISTYQQILKCKTWDDILEKAGLPTYKKINADSPEEIIRFTRKFISEHKITSLRKLLKHPDYASEDFILKRFTSMNEFVRLVGLDVISFHEQCQLTDSYLIGLYKKLSKQIGANRGATIKDINEHLPWPAYVFMKRFGSMKRLRQRAGYQPTSKSRYTENEIMEVLKNKTMEVGRMLTKADVNKDPNCPWHFTCENATEKKFSTLKETAYRLAGIEKNKH